MKMVCRFFRCAISALELLSPDGGVSAKSSRILGLPLNRTLVAESANIAVTVALATLPSLALAHHSFAPHFDSNKPVTIADAGISARVSPGSHGA